MPYEVIKTLVVGLGSTGTDVCDALVRRIEWELGDVNRAPWVRFLSLETNADHSTPLRHSGDFYAIGINADNYKYILDNPADFDESIKLNEWADLGTLSRLDLRDATAGAGNIRMVGRLTFLYKDNYSRLKQQVQNRMDWLRDLKEAEATSLRGPLSDGNNPPVGFLGGSVRIIVVGTLVGGTCSGIVSDFGYFLKFICRENEKVIGVFSLPRSDLTDARDVPADRFKKNAFHALIELNHYSLSGRGDENRIKFSDGQEVDLGTFPYDLPYLVMPKRVGDVGTIEINQAIADRVFLNIFAPETDPFARAIDIPIPTRRDRNDHAHVFCTFGLSTFEFPAYQIIEACSNRLLAYALRQWLSRELPDDQIDARVKDAGLSEIGLRDLLLQLPQGDSLLHRFSQEERKMLEQAQRDVQSARQSLEQLRQAFIVDGQVGGADALPRVPGVVRDNRVKVAEQLYMRLMNTAGARLLDYFDGPAVLRQLLERAQVKLNELSQQKASDYHEAAEHVDRLLDEIAAYHHSPLLAFVHLRKSAIDGIREDLRQALQNEVQARLMAEIYRVLGPTTETSAEPGVIERIRRVLNPVQQRVQNLIDRGQEAASRMHARWVQLAVSKPNVSGVVFLEQGGVAGIGGTADREYMQCLTDAGQVGDHWENVQEKVATTIIKSWADLPGLVFPLLRSERSGVDFLLEHFNANSDKDPILTADKERLIQAARKPFEKLTKVDVLERWSVAGDTQANRNAQARGIAERTESFLRVVSERAQRGGLSPVQTRRTILVPDSPQYNESFMTAVQPVLRDAKRGTSPDRFRVVFLEEWYRFPLSGVPAVLGRDSISAAICNDFPTFFSRKDVFWAPISDAEIQSVGEAHELTVVAILLDLLRPVGGVLTMNWPPTPLGAEPDRQLPPSIHGAALRLARGDADLQDHSLQGAAEILRRRIEDVRNGFPNAVDAIERDKSFIKAILGGWTNDWSAVISDWNRPTVERYLFDYFGGDAQLRRAFLALHTPEQVEKRLKREKGAKKRSGEGNLEKSGYYCPNPNCDGLIGETLDEAARNGWQCFIDPSHTAGIVPLLPQASKA